jgi:hypothetical protein
MWFRQFYNEYRPHQHLGYRTATEAWRRDGIVHGRALWDFRELHARPD